MCDGLPAESRVAFEAWLESAACRLVSCAPAYHPPGARPGRDTGRAALQSPDREVRFRFASISGEKGQAWRAELQVPANSAVGTWLPVSVFDGEGRCAGNGLLKLAGCDIRIQEGRGRILFELFVGGAKDTGVSFTRDGGKPSSGLLTFFGEGKG